MKAKASELQQIDRELDARACEHALWISLLIAQRMGWEDVVTSLTLMHATALERRRALEAMA